MEYIYKKPITNIFEIDSFENSIKELLFENLPVSILHVTGVLLKPIVIQIPNSYRDLVKSFKSCKNVFIDGSVYKNNTELFYLEFENISVPIIFSSDCNEQVIAYYLKETRIAILGK